MGDLTTCSCSSSAGSGGAGERAEATAWMPCEATVCTCGPKAGAACGDWANFRRILSSPRSKSNSLISFSLRNSTSSFNSLSSSGVMNLSSSSELRPRGGCRGQYLPVLPGYGNHIFDAHSKLTWNVNAGLNGDDHSRHKGLRLVRGNAGCLMNFEPHAMTGGMTEVVSQAGFAKDAARCVVYVTTGD